jgi:hypothetical protein
MSALRDVGGNLPNTRTMTQGIVPAIGRDLLAGVLDRDAGRAFWIVWVGGDLDHQPEAARFRTGGVERA